MKIRQTFKTPISFSFNIISWNEEIKNFNSLNKCKVFGREWVPLIKIFIFSTYFSSIIRIFYFLVLTVCQSLHIEKKPHLKSCEKSERKHVPQMCSLEACVATGVRWMRGSESVLCHAVFMDKTCQVKETQCKK